MQKDSVSCLSGLKVVVQIISGGLDLAAAMADCFKSDVMRFIQIEPLADNAVDIRPRNRTAIGEYDLPALAGALFTTRALATIYLKSL